MLIYIGAKVTFVIVVVCVILAAVIRVIGKKVN